MRSLINKNLFKHIDWVIMALIGTLVAFSLLSITNITADPFTGDEHSFSEIWQNLNLNNTLWQFLFFVVGLVLFFGLLIIDYNSLRHITKYIYWLCVLLLVLVLFFGSTQKGTSGWFIIGGRGFQPSEFCKIALILTCSKIIADQTEGNEDGITTFAQLWPVLWRFAIPFILVAAQPDFGTAFVFIAIFLGILFIAKTTLKMFLFILGIGGASIPIVWLLLDPYQKNRIFSFFSIETTDATSLADSQYQANQAKLAIGSGQLTGKGMFSSGSMSQLGYVPEESNDFIFAATTETFGFIGAFILILLYALLIIRTAMLAMRAKDDFGTYIGIGVMSMILFHVFENISMNIGLMPITGISLPFFSYGGSNLIVNMIAYSLVINVDIRRQRWPSS